MPESAVVHEAPGSNLHTESRPQLLESLNPTIGFLLLISLVFVVVPIFQIPVLGVSFAAPAIFLLALEVLMGSTGAKTLNRWFFWGLLIWLNMVGSLWINILLGAATPDAQVLLNIFRYSYWLATFAVIASLTSNTKIARRASSMIGLSVVFLAGVRLWEGMVAGGWGLHGRFSDLSLLTKNLYGIQFSTFALFGLLFLFSKAGILRHVISTVMCLFIVIVILGNGSRSGWVALAVGMSLFALIHILTNRNKWYLWILPVVFFVGLGVFVPLPEGIEGVINYQLRTFDDLEVDKSYAFRQVMNEKNWKIFWAHPLFGVGVGQSDKTYVANLDIPRVLRRTTDYDLLNRSAHNSYMLQLAETGVIGMAPYLLLLAMLSIRGFRACVILAWRKEIWAIGVYCSFVAMSIHLWSLSGLGSTAPWLIYGFVAGMIDCEASVLDDKRVRLCPERLL
jgi:O-antigen ligase